MGRPPIGHMEPIVDRRRHPLAGRTGVGPPVAPEGWRWSAGRRITDTYFYSPTDGRRFRSRTEVEKYLAEVPDGPSIDDFHMRFLATGCEPRYKSLDEHRDTPRERERRDFKEGELPGNPLPVRLLKFSEMQALRKKAKPSKDKIFNKLDKRKSRNPLKVSKLEDPLRRHRKAKIFQQKYSSKSHLDHGGESNVEKMSGRKLTKRLYTKWLAESSESLQKFLTEIGYPGELSHLTMEDLRKTLLTCRLTKEKLSSFPDSLLRLFASVVRKETISLSLGTTSLVELCLSLRCKHRHSWCSFEAGGQWFLLSSSPLKEAEDQANDEEVKQEDNGVLILVDVSNSKTEQVRGGCEPPPPFSLKVNESNSDTCMEIVSKGIDSSSNGLVDCYSSEKETIGKIEDAMLTVSIGAESSWQLCERDRNYASEEFHLCDSLHAKPRNNGDTSSEYGRGKERGSKYCQCSYCEGDMNYCRGCTCAFCKIITRPEDSDIFIKCSCVHVFHLECALKFKVAGLAGEKRRNGDFVCPVCSESLSLVPIWKEKVWSALMARDAGTLKMFLASATHLLHNYGTHIWQDLQNKLEQACELMCHSSPLELEPLIQAIKEDFEILLSVPSAELLAQSQALAEKRHLEDEAFAAAAWVQKLEDEMGQLKQAKERAAECKEIAEAAEEQSRKAEAELALRVLRVKTFEKEGGCCGRRPVINGDGSVSSPLQAPLPAERFNSEKATVEFLDLQRLCKQIGHMNCLGENFFPEFAALLNSLKAQKERVDLARGGKRSRQC